MPLCGLIIITIISSLLFASMCVSHFAHGTNIRVEVAAKGIEMIFE